MDINKNMTTEELFEKFKTENGMRELSDVELDKVIGGYSVENLPEDYKNKLLEDIRIMRDSGYAYEDTYNLIKMLLFYDYHGHEVDEASLNSFISQVYTGASGGW